MSKLRSFGRAAGKWFGIMSGPLSIPIGVFALFNAWSQQKTLAVLAYLALWGTVFYLIGRLRKAEQRPQLLPWEVLESKLWEGEELLRLIADTSQSVPAKQPERWIDGALDCLRMHAKDQVRRFKIIVEYCDVGVPAEGTPPEIENRPFDKSWTRDRKSQWEKLAACLDVFRELDKRKPPVC